MGEKELSNYSYKDYLDIDKTTPADVMLFCKDENVKVENFFE